MKINPFLFIKKHKKLFYVLSFISISFFFYLSTTVGNTYFIKNEFSKLGIIPKNIVSDSIIHNDYSLYQDIDCNIRKYDYYSNKKTNNLSIHFPISKIDTYFYLDIENGYVQKHFLKVPENGIIELNPNFNAFTIWVITNNRITVKNGIVTNHNSFENVDKNIYILNDDKKYKAKESLFIPIKNDSYKKFLYAIINNNLLQVIIFIFFALGFLSILNYILELKKGLKKISLNHISQYYKDKSKFIKLISFIIFTGYPTYFFYNQLIKDDLEVTINKSFVIPKINLIKSNINNPEAFFREQPTNKNEANNKSEKFSLTVDVMDKLLENREKNGDSLPRFFISTGMQFYDNIVLTGINTNTLNNKNHDNSNRLMNFELSNNSNQIANNIILKSENNDLKYVRINNGNNNTLNNYRVKSFYDTIQLTNRLEPNNKIIFSIYSETEDKIQIYSDKFYAIRKNEIIGLLSSSKIDYFISKHLYKNIYLQFIVFIISILGIFNLTKTVANKVYKK